MTTYLKPDWPAPKHVMAFSTTRHGGYSDPPFNSMNLSYQVNDNIKHVDRNHQQLTKDLNLPERPIWLKQVHSNRAVSIDSLTNIQADASFTATPNRICAVMTADCLPILICNRNGTEVAAIHAGWRGLLRGIIDETIKKLTSNPTELLAWLGPAIGPEAFALNKDIKNAFIKRDKNNQDSFKHINTTIFADIYHLARVNLNRCGVSQIYSDKYCTVQNEDLFYSYRRDGGTTGRMAHLIWLTEESSL